MTGSVYYSNCDTFSLECPMGMSKTKVFISPLQYLLHFFWQWTHHPPRCSILETWELSLASPPLSLSLGKYQYVLLLPMYLLKWIRSPSPTVLSKFQSMSSILWITRTALWLDSLLPVLTVVSILCIMVTFWRWSDQAKIQKILRYSTHKTFQISLLSLGQMKLLNVVFHDLVLCKLLSFLVLSTPPVRLFFSPRDILGAFLTELLAQFSFLCLKLFSPCPFGLLLLIK